MNTVIGYENCHRNWNFWRTLSHASDALWKAVAPQTREQLENPYDILQNIPMKRLEEKVIPEFYTRDAVGIPRAWVARYN